MMDIVKPSSLTDDATAHLSGPSSDQSSSEFAGLLSEQSLGTHDLKYGLTESLLKEVVQSNVSPQGKGKPVDGIPNTKPDAEKRSLTVMNAQTGEMVSTGDMNHRFSQQSMSKPTAMALAMKLMGGPNAYRQYVGVEASGRPYNATELLPDGRPFNSSVNAGALATWVLIHAHTPQGKKAFDLYMDEMKTLTGNPNLKVNEDMAKGEFEYQPPDGGPSGNQKLMQVLDDQGLMRVLEKQNGDRPLSPQQKQELMNLAFQDYCRACAVMVNTQDMARVAAVYRNGGVLVDAKTGARTQALPKEIADCVSRSNDVTGSYNESGTQFAKNNFGGKTGVDGGIFGSLRGQSDPLVVAGHHSDLNAAGNPGEVQKYIGALSKLDLAFPQPPRSTDRLPAALGETSQSKPAELSPGKLGPSPREVDQQLHQETPDESLGVVRRQLRLLTADDKGFYMKAPDETKSKDPLLGATRLLTAKDNEGKWKNYYHASGNHQLHKVLVTDGDPKLGRGLISA
jgi:glutaminase